MGCCSMCGCFFFFKQKTAYEMRISDWSSDVCSSDLFAGGRGRQVVGGNRGGGVGAGSLPAAAATPPGGAGGRFACLPPGFEPAHGAAALIPSPENTIATEPASGGSTQYINNNLNHPHDKPGNATGRERERQTV